MGSVKRAREMMLHYFKKELLDESDDEIIKEVYKSLEAYVVTDDYEHVHDLYFAALCLMLKSTQYDEEIMDMIIPELEILFPQLN